MNKTKFIVRVAMCVALLIGGQFALSSVAGVEIVTVTLLCFCYCYGVKHGLAVATTYSLLRCFVFGFEPTVLMLYLIYYNLFAAFFGWLGGRFAGKLSIWKTVIVVISAVVFTGFFTLLDDAINMIVFLAYGMSKNAAKIYFYQSLPVMVPQMGCAAITVSVGLHPLTQVIKKVNF